MMVGIMVTMDMVMVMIIFTTGIRIIMVTIIIILVTITTMFGITKNLVFQIPIRLVRVLGGVGDGSMVIVGFGELKPNIDQELPKKRYGNTIQAEIPSMV